MLKYIHRHDYDGTHGYLVRIPLGRGKKLNKFFADKKNGGKAGVDPNSRKVKKVLRDIRDEIESLLKLFP